MQSQYVSRNTLLQLLVYRVKFLCLGNRAEEPRLHTAHPKTRKSDKNKFENTQKISPVIYKRPVNVLIWKTSFSFKKDQKYHLKQVNVKSNKTELAAIKATLVYGFGILFTATLPASQQPYPVLLPFSLRTAAS